MKSQSFNILFIMRSTRIKKNGLASIYARITARGMRQELYTLCDGNPELWDQKKERALGTNKLSTQVNETLNEFRVKIMEVRRTLLAEGYEANAMQIKRRYLNPQCDTLMLIKGLTDYCKRRQDEVGVRITQRTADKYDRLLRYLKEFLAKRGQGDDIPVENINYEFLDGFNLFLQPAHRCRHNGQSVYWIVCVILYYTVFATNGSSKIHSNITNSKKTRRRPRNIYRFGNSIC